MPDLDEARLIEKLRAIEALYAHPNVVSVLDVGEDARGAFLVMDFVEGVSTVALVRRAALRWHHLPLQVCLRVIMEAAEGLHAAHELRDARGRPVELVFRRVPVPSKAPRSGRARATRRSTGCPRRGAGCGRARGRSARR